MSFDEPPLYDEKEYELWSENRKWVMDAAKKLFAHLYGENAKHGGLYEWADIIQWAYDKHREAVKSARERQNG